MLFVSYTIKNVMYVYFVNEEMLTLFTDTVWVSNVANSANTDCSVIVDLAFCIHSTFGCETWVLTFLLDAC